MIRRPVGRPPIPDSELLAEIRRLADEFGAAPTAVQMEKHGRYSVTTYRKHFNRWNLALRHAGFEDRR